MPLNHCTESAHDWRMPMPPTSTAFVDVKATRVCGPFIALRNNTGKYALRETLPIWVAVPPLNRIAGARADTVDFLSLQHTSR